jgi:hypothetical protein
VEYKLKILGESPRTSKKVRVVAECVCGNLKTYLKSNVGRVVNSCGCKKDARMSIHGMYKSKTYNTWDAMVQRCTNPKHASYKHYGGRGITVCERWRIFENFYEDMVERPERKQLDRIDNNKGYFPENCRWATAKENINNRGISIKIDLGYFQLTLGELADLAEMSYEGMLYRWHRYGNAWDCLFPPIRMR